MKSYRNLLSVLGVFVFTFLFFTSCKKEAMIESSSSEAIDTETQRQIEFLVNTFGHQEEQIKITADYYVVDTDLIYPRNNFQENYGTSPELPASIENLVKESNARYHFASPYLISRCGTIPVHVNPKLPYKWRVAVYNAIKEWNKLDGCVKLKYYRTNSYTYRGINVKYASLIYEDAPAWAARPRSNGYAGNEILINHEYNGYLSSSKKKHTMVHELGHTLGFDHTDTPYNNDSWWVRYVPRHSCWKKDPNSVMQPHIDSWSGFSYCDKKAFQFLY